MKCFYHKDDLDGICSGAIVYNHFKDCDIEMIGIDHNYNLNDYNFSQREHIIICDISFKPDEMLELNDVCYLVWIDHHISAIKDLEKYGFDGLRRVGTAACQLTWEYFHGTKYIPESVKYLSQYDVWDHSDSNTLPFQYGMRLKNLSVDDKRWEYYFHDGFFINNTIVEGKTVLKYEEQQNKKLMQYSYYTEFEGYKAIVVNKSFGNSKIFDSIDRDTFDIMIIFNATKDNFKYSLYTHRDDIDVSEICKRYGGGGHKQAAGFYNKEKII